MRNLAQIRELLVELDHHPADDLEDQDLDFKEWRTRSLADAVDLVVEMAVCMANGGGGTVVFGVRDRVVGRERAILGVPPEVDLNRLKKAVYDHTEPKLTPELEELAVPEGTGRLLVMQVHGGLPPYTDTAGRGKVRIGKDCQPLTGTLRRRVMVETGESDVTAEVIPGEVADLVSAAALEQLRDVARQERAPADLLRLGDLDLLDSLGVLRGGQLTCAGLLLAGRADAMEEHVPGYLWTYLRMRGDTDYVDRADGREPVPVAVARITERLMVDNPLVTLDQGLFHFEYRTYPAIVLREALMNAFSHRDFRLAGPVLVKQFANRVEISNPGGFIGGITPDNILHHQPVARNPRLVEALTRLRLVNRSNLGVGRMFEALLAEGKEPPILEEQGDAVRLTLVAGELSAPFRTLVAEEERRGRELSVDHLLILRYLLRHAELDTATAAALCQRREAEVRETLSQMERVDEYLERGGTGRGTYWSLRPAIHQRLAGPGHPERDRRLDWEAVKTRVLSILQQRAARGEGGLSNSDIRQVTHLDRNQVKRLMAELREEGHTTTEGSGRAARWTVPSGPDDR